MPFPYFQFGIHPLDIYFRQTNPFFQLWFQLLLCKISWFLKWLDCFVRPMRNCSKFSLLFLLIIPLIQLQNPPLVRTWGLWIVLALSVNCSCPLSIYSQSCFFLFTFRGVIQLNNETYIIQPLAGQTSGVSHVTVLINVFSPIKLLTHGLYSLNLRSGGGGGVRLMISNQ